LPPSQLAGKAYTLYEKFRPEIPPGRKGWGASGNWTSSVRWLRLTGIRQIYGLFLICGRTKVHVQITEYFITIA